ncbi:ATP-binding cassette domain-containing protein [Bacillus gobiensis]|uniref:ABC transporter ATP-binding protein n=1 Tax=Bacillus gobiensis TaxID=1441095 RepID=UPI003D1CD9E5
MSEVLVTVNDLTFSLNKQPLLKNISAHFQKGRIYGLLGPNGAGKTTLLKSLLGVFTPDHGQVTYKGEPIDSQKDYLHRVGSVIEYPGFYEHLTLEENLILHMKTLRLKTDREHIRSMLGRVGLTEHIQKKFSQTSLGMKQRLGLARAMIHDPEFLLLDEPTNGLDPRGIKEMRDVLLELARNEKRSILLSSHILSEISKLADELLIMKNGEIVFRAAVPDHNQTFLSYQIEGSEEHLRKLAAIFHHSMIRLEKSSITMASARDLSEITESVEKLKCKISVKKELTLEELYLELLEQGEA